MVSLPSKTKEGVIGLAATSNDKGQNAVNRARENRNEGEK
jgi:hypothetical protein